MHNIQTLLPGAPDGWQFQVIYKSIRHIYFRVYPDKKLVRISAPSHVSEKTLGHAVAAKSAWLMRNVCALDNAASPVQPLPEIKPRSSCMVWGTLLPVTCDVCNGRPQISMAPETGIVIRGPLAFDPKKQENLLDKWLRRLLTRRIQELLEQWQPVMGVTPSQFRIRKMKTRWGSCNTSAGRIWINAALVHPAPGLLEYVLVHELAHLLEPGHTRRFYRILETYLPDWKDREARLDQCNALGIAQK